MGWSKREEKNLPSSRQMSREGKADRLQKGKKIFMKESIWERNELSSMDYFVLRAKSKNTKEAPIETVSATLLFSRQSSEASAEMCIFSTHCKRNARIVSLTNQHSKMSFSGKRSELSAWKKTLCTYSIFLCS